MELILVVAISWAPVSLDASAMNFGQLRAMARFPEALSIMRWLETTIVAAVWFT
jgi:hypothetical protein